MSLRDKVMDKYWIEYLKHETKTYGKQPSESNFWSWFYKNIYKDDRKSLGEFV